MKFSEKWLREWVDPAIDTTALVEQLTMAGLEVDAVEPVAGPFSGVLVGEILSAEQHPDADKLRVCQVSTGTDTVQVVCGAANARAGLKVPFATVGAVLPGDFKIKKAKLRGVESFGMLCAEQELGMAESSDGLMELPADAPAGTDIRDYLGLDDTLIEVDLTPNRADCLSIRGVARDAATLNRLPLNTLEIAPVAAVNDEHFPVEIRAEQDCPRYAGRVIRNVDVSRPTPLWMVEKLRRSGIRSIDPVVDITNYVLLELGQPMHAFDLAKLQGGIVVRKAEEGERILLLDGQELKLKAESLVIADQQRPVALAGIMGGQETAVSETTRDIFLESAFFAPAQIAGRARSYGLHTDSSHRFERGVDYRGTVEAIERATALILDVVGGEPGPVSDLGSDAQPVPAEIVLREERIEKMLGVSLPAEEVEAILQGLGLEVERNADGWLTRSPSWRFDLAIEVDLLEELARVYGYNRLPVKPIRETLDIRPRPEERLELRSLRRQLLARGYQEAITYSFVEPELQKAMTAGAEAVALMNPISSDMSVMRTTLWPGLVKSVAYNLNRQQSRVRLFETGLRFVPGSDGLRQEPVLAAVITGRRDPESWVEQGDKVDFYDLKGDLDALLALSGADFEYRAGEHPALHPGQCAEILRGGEVVGHIGALHPGLYKTCDLEQPVFLLELSLDAVLDRQLPAFQPLSRFPEVRRDLAVIIDREVPAAGVVKIARAAAGTYVTNLKLFDIYEGEGIDPKRKSLGLGLTYQHSSRTLNEDEVNTSIDQIVQALEERFGATLRK